MTVKNADRAKALVVVFMVMSQLGMVDCHSRERDTKKEVTRKAMMEMYYKSKQIPLSSSEVKYALSVAKNKEISYRARIPAILALSYMTASPEILSTLREMMGDKTLYAKDGGSILMATATTLTGLCDVKAMELIRLWKKYVENATEKDVSDRKKLLRVLENYLSILGNLKRRQVIGEHVPTLKLLEKTIIPNFNILDLDVRKSFSAIESLSRNAGAKKLRIRLEGVEANDKVSISVSNIPVLTLLKMICSSHELNCNVLENTIVISPFAVKKSKVKLGKNRKIIMIRDLELVLISIAPGSFMMGSNAGESDEKPVHKVTLTEPFWMGRTEVTQAQWRAIMRTNPSPFKGEDDPVQKVSWNDCVKFCKKLTVRERAAGRLPANQEYRLPTEAEWEYCARGGVKSKGYKYSGSDTIGDVAWYDGNSGNETHPVAQKQPNELGLYDMSGNVWEWCGDYYDWSYPRDAQVNPTGPRSSKYRVIRGGCWYSYAELCRSSQRHGLGQSLADYYLGFRIVRAFHP